LCIADINTTFFKKVNPAFIAKLGFSEKELLSRSFLDFIHPDDVDDTRAMVEKKLKAGENVINFTNRYRCADGAYLWLEWVSNPRPERGVKFAVGHDITQRQLTEKKLRENQIFIHTVMDNLPLGIAFNSVDPTVNFEHMNDNFPTFYRTTRRALMADPDRFWDAVYEDPEFRQQIKKRVLDDRALGDPERMFWEDIPITRKGRPVRYVSAKNTPIPEKGLMV
jgi:PAS domain S-box-containing protein